MPLINRAGYGVYTYDNSFTSTYSVDKKWAITFANSHLQNVQIEILTHKCIKIGLGYTCNYLLVDRYSPYK